MPFIAANSPTAGCWQTAASRGGRQVVAEARKREEEEEGGKKKNLPVINSYNCSKMTQQQTHCPCFWRGERVGVRLKASVDPKMG